MTVTIINDKNRKEEFKNVSEIKDTGISIKIYWDTTNQRLPRAQRTVYTEFSRGSVEIIKVMI